MRHHPPVACLSLGLRPEDLITPEGEDFYAIWSQDRFGENPHPPTRSVGGQYQRISSRRSRLSKTRRTLIRRIRVRAPTRYLLSSVVSHLTVIN